MLEVIETTLRCRMCNSEFTDEQVENATCCPKCQTAQLPVRISHDVSVTINWSDLRILTAWAEGYIRKNGTEDNIELMRYLKETLRPLRPEDAMPLTLVEEFQELQDAGYDAELVQDGQVLVARRLRN